MGDVHHCSGHPVSEMTYTVSSGTINSTIPHHLHHLVLQQNAKWFDILVQAYRGVGISLLKRTMSCHVIEEMLRSVACMSGMPLVDLQLPNRITTTDVGLQYISSK